MLRGYKTHIRFVVLGGNGQGQNLQALNWLGQEPYVGKLFSQGVGSTKVNSLLSFKAVKSEEERTIRVSLVMTMIKYIIHIDSPKYKIREENGAGRVVEKVIIACHVQVKNLPK